MKAAVCREFGKPLHIEELNLAAPGAGEVRVRLAACAICHSDIHYLEGAWGGDLPAVYGHEAAGVVEEIGDGVTFVETGDHVVVTLIRSCGHCFFCARGEPTMCDGEFTLDKQRRIHASDGTPIVQGLRTAAFAEQVVVHQSQVVPVPASLRLDSASLLACGVITGLGAVVNTASMPCGSTVAVIGTGGVGLNSVQGAVISGAKRIIAVDTVEDKLEAARIFGATDTVNCTREDAAAAVRSLSGGRGADYVFVTVGSVRAVEDSVRMLRRGGTAVIVGMPAAGATAAIEPLELADNSQRIIGSKMGATRLAVDIPRLVDLYEQGRLKLDELISARYPLEDINEAIASVNRAEALRNVIVF